MSVYAVVQNGIVINTVLWDGVSEWDAPEGASVNLLPEGSPVGCGYMFDGTTYTPPVFTPSPQPF